MNTEASISMTVNGRQLCAAVPGRRSLAEFLREDLGLTGTHLGCEQGVCGACTVLLDGRSVPSCLVLAAQADGCTVSTVEGLADGDKLHPIQAAFWQEHGLQCGFCTPGFLMTVYEFLLSTHGPTEDEVRRALAGNVCRCTGYQNIIKAVMAADLMWER
jgi:carbon-monoxide dehydrogenase small subunit